MKSCFQQWSSRSFLNCPQSPLKSPRPAWKGMMQALHNGDHPGKSEEFFLPMIDLNPGDLSCIYSTLRFVTAQASRCRMTPVITFDQPLYLKALSIISSEEAGRELNSIVLRLGCFHMQMSFLGRLGYLMAGPGLQEATELVFAPNVDIHMLSGKAYDRAACRCCIKCPAFAFGELLVSRRMTQLIFTCASVRRQESTNETMFPVRCRQNDVGETTCLQSRKRHLHMLR